MDDLYRELRILTLRNDIELSANKLIDARIALNELSKSGEDYQQAVIKIREDADRIKCALREMIIELDELEDTR